ncbi:hypothetical protein ABH945_002181 [Paraburkholderia sp. GAS333]|uniref:hypothetical protein n=1 Tax=Paraburkholderia sp. GAS333 TaxID=3156279 RepID=UPI003D1D06F1
MGWSVEDFKKTSMEVGQWCWGTMQGAFNEKQTISQIITDAVIGMIPILGDVTAVRDLLAVSIGMSTDARKRQQVMEWVLLVVLVFALIPIVGGVIKGVGRLSLRVAGDAAKDEKLLSEVVEFLNRMGHGDAPKWLRSLDVKKYQAEILAKFKSFCTTVHRTIEKTLDASVGKMLPTQWHMQLQTVSDGFETLPDIADKMVPKALAELDNKIRVLQNAAYEGESRSIATGGKPKVERESEAVLEEKARPRKFPQGPYPARSARVDGPLEARLQAEFGPNIKKGWPDLFYNKGKMPVFGEEEVYRSIASFHGAITAVDARQLAGKKLYRAFGKKSEVTTAGKSDAGGFFGGSYWGVGDAPRSAEEWRTQSAVLDDWNANGFLVVAHLPDNLADLWPEAKAWIGKISEQYSEKEPLQYLEGGGEQLLASFGKAITDRITAVGETVKDASHSGTHTEIINGVRFDFFKTNWEDVERVYGYGKSAEDTGAASTRKLAQDEVRDK